MTGDPETWSPEEWADLDEALAEAERVDPVIAAAAQRLDDALWRLTNGVPRARFPRPLPNRNPR